MNRRDYIAHIALRDTARMDRSHAHAVAVPVYRPRRKRAPLAHRIASAVRSLFV